MIELTPDRIALKDELMPAFQRDHQRRQGRRKAARTAVIGLAAFAALSGSAVAAGSALGIIDLGGGVSATQVTTLPVWDGTTGTFDSGTANGQYIYEFAGLGADSVVCGATDPDVATFITSTQPLTQSDLESLIDPSNPVGINPGIDLHAFGITSESGGCFPPSVAGPLGVAQTPSQAAAGQAMAATLTAQLQAGTAGGPQTAHASRLQDVAITHDGKRVIVRLRGRIQAVVRAGHPSAVAQAIARSADKTK